MKFQWQKFGIATCDVLDIKAIKVVMFTQILVQQELRPLSPMVEHRRLDMAACYLVDLQKLTVCGALPRVPLLALMTCCLGTRVTLILPSTPQVPRRP